MEAVARVLPVEGKKPVASDVSTHGQVVERVGRQPAKGRTQRVGKEIDERRDREQQRRRDDQRPPPRQRSNTTEDATRRSGTLLRSPLFFDYLGRFLPRAHPYHLATSTLPDFNPRG